MKTASTMETVWLQRAERLARRPVVAEGGRNASPVLVLAIAAERYGIALPDVAEVLSPVHPTPVPGTAEVFAGVINVHGGIRPVMDLRRLLGMPPPKSDMASGGGLARVILLRQRGRELGLQIDSVEHIRWIVPGELQPARTDLIESSPYIQGSTPDLLMLLSTGALFAELHTTELDPAQLSAGELYTGVTL